MAKAVAWFMFLLGIGHIVFGLIRYKGPVTETMAAVFVGNFAMPETSRTAFWFLIFGPLLMVTGQVAIHAVAQGDLALLQLLGIYTFMTAVLGAAAFPRPPFWAPLFVAPELIAVDYEWLPQA